MAIYSRPSIQNTHCRWFRIRKLNALLNLIKNQLDTDKIYLHAKGPYKAKYQYLIKKSKKVGLNHFNDLKAFMQYSNDMQDVYKNIEDYNPGKKRKIFPLSLSPNHILKYQKILE